MTPEQTKKFKYWQTRTIVVTMVGYALYYFVRKNFNTAMPSIEVTFGITKAQLGLFLTLNGIIYGLSRFINGFIADRVSARKVMSLGLALSALVNIGFGFSDKMAMLVAGTAGGQESSTRPAPHDSLGAGQRTGPQNVDLEHVALDRGRVDLCNGRRAGTPFRQQRMAALFSHSCGVFAFGSGRFVPCTARQTFFGGAART